MSDQRRSLKQKYVPTGDPQAREKRRIPGEGDKEIREKKEATGKKGSPWEGGKWKGNLGPEKG